MYECHEELAANKEDYTFGMEILEFVQGEGKETHIHQCEVDFVG